MQLARLRLLALLSLALFIALATACTTGGDSADIDPGAEPKILILGTTHLAQTEQRVPDQEVVAAMERLRPFAPDMIVVEYLPPEWPVGKGRDYRKTFDLSSYAKAWDIPLDSVEQYLTMENAEHVEMQRCKRARLHFLKRDYPTALYYWLAAECAAERDSTLAGWIEKMKEHEMARVAFPLGRLQEVRSVVSFDYQGEDTKWFFGSELFEEIRQEGTAAERAELDSFRVAVKELRRAAVAASDEGTYLESLRFFNSRRWMELQQRIYEEAMPKVTYDSAGERQRENYWSRNRKMFDEIDEAVEQRRLERILVVVGAGHKYFLDEIARERGYEWIDPQRYLESDS